MMLSNEAQVHTRKKHHGDDDTEDPTAPFYELTAFNSTWEGLRWTEIRTRVPICFKKTIRNRYMLANLVYLGYAIGILIIDFNPSVNGSSSSSGDSDYSYDYDTSTTNDSTITIAAYTSPLDKPVDSVPLVNRLYIGK